jgi:hypothetical protein
VTGSDGLSLHRVAGPATFAGTVIAVSSAGRATRTPPRQGAGRGIARALLALTLALATVGAAVLIWTDDARLLRLGIVAGLWAALIGAFAAARYRREVHADRDRSEELRRVYELELEREVAARREYELEVETQTRRRLEEEVRNEVRDELTGLRAELHSLRQNLEALLGGEVLVERVALRAESTRLRSLSDQARAARSADRALTRGSAGAGVAESGSQADSSDRTLVLPRYREPTSSGFSVTQPTEFKPRRHLQPASGNPEPEASVPWLTFTGPRSPQDPPAQANQNGSEGPAPELVDTWAPAGTNGQSDSAEHPSGSGADQARPSGSEDTGSHTVGKSVSELVTALGGPIGTNATPRRRRRRAEDQ